MSRLQAIRLEINAAGLFFPNGLQPIHLQPSFLLNRRVQPYWVLTMLRSSFIQALNARSLYSLIDKRASQGTGCLGGYSLPARAALALRTNAAMAQCHGVALEATSYRLFSRLIALPSWRMAPAYRYYAIPYIDQGDVKRDEDNPSQTVLTVIATFYWQYLQPIHYFPWERVKRFPVTKQSALRLLDLRSDFGRSATYVEHAGQALKLPGNVWRIRQADTASPLRTLHAFYTRYLNAPIAPALEKSLAPRIQLTPRVRQSLSRRHNSELKNVPSRLDVSTQREKSLPVETLYNYPRARTQYDRHDRSAEITRLQLKGIQRLQASDCFQWDKQRDKIKRLHIEKASAFRLLAPRNDFSRLAPYAVRTGQILETPGSLWRIRQDITASPLRTLHAVYTRYPNTPIAPALEKSLAPRIQLTPRVRQSLSRRHNSELKSVPSRLDVSTQREKSLPVETLYNYPRARTQYDRHDRSAEITRLQFKGIQRLQASDCLQWDKQRDKIKRLHIEKASAFQLLAPRNDFSRSAPYAVRTGQILETPGSLWRIRQDITASPLRTLHAVYTRYPNTPIAPALEKSLAPRIQLTPRVRQSLSRRHNSELKNVPFRLDVATQREKSLPVETLYNYPRARTQYDRHDRSAEITRLQLKGIQRLQASDCFQWDKQRDKIKRLHIEKASAFQLLAPRNDFSRSAPYAVRTGQILETPGSLWRIRQDITASPLRTLHAVYTRYPNAPIAPAHEKSLAPRIQLTPRVRQSLSRRHNSELKSVPSRLDVSTQRERSLPVETLYNYPQARTQYDRHDRSAEITRLQFKGIQRLQASDCLQRDKIKRLHIEKASAFQLLAPRNDFSRSAPYAVRTGQILETPGSLWRIRQDITASPLRTLHAVYTRYPNAPIAPAHEKSLAPRIQLTPRVRQSLSRRHKPELKSVPSRPDVSTQGERSLPIEARYNHQRAQPQPARAAGITRLQLKEINQLQPESIQRLNLNSRPGDFSQPSALKILTLAPKGALKPSAQRAGKQAPFAHGHHGFLTRQKTHFEGQGDKNFPGNRSDSSDLQAVRLVTTVANNSQAIIKSGQREHQQALVDVQALLTAMRGEQNRAIHSLQQELEQLKKQLSAAQNQPLAALVKPPPFYGVL